MNKRQRDSQRQRVYNWENETLPSLTKRIIPFKDAQTFVDGVWLAHGWLYPPEVTLIAKQATRKLAMGGRMKLKVQKNTPAWVILHELAHTLTSDLDKSDQHGADFMGIYLKLLEDVLNLSNLMLMYSLKEKNISFNLGVVPWMQRKE